MCIFTHLPQYCQLGKIYHDNPWPFDIRFFICIELCQVGQTRAVSQAKLFEPLSEREPGDGICCPLPNELLARTVTPQDRARWCLICRENIKEEDRAKRVSSQADFPSGVPRMPSSGMEGWGRERYQHRDGRAADTGEKQIRPPPGLGKARNVKWKEEATGNPWVD